MESLFVQQQISTVCQENGSKASLPCLLPFSEVLTWISAVLSLPAVLKVEHTGLHLGWLPSFWWRFPWFWPELQSGQHTGIANVKTKVILPTFLCPFPTSLPVNAALPMRQPPRAQRGRALPENSTLPEHIHICQTLPAQDKKLKSNSVTSCLPCHTRTYLIDEQEHCTGCFITHQTTTSSISSKEDNSLPYFILVVLVGSDSVTHTKAFYSNNEWQVWWL